MFSPQRVVITGLGALTPLGNSVQESWANLLERKSGAGPIERFDASKFKTRFACELKRFSASDFLDKKTIRTSDRFTQYALIAGEEAWRDAKLTNAKINRARCGVIWGSGNGGVGTFEKEVRDYYLQDEQARFNPYFIPKTLLDTPSGALALKFGLHGVNFAAAAACAASNVAIIEAMNYIRWGKADLVLCGGSEAPITPAWLGGFQSLKALSTRNEAPESASRPLDVSRDGFVLGEGAGALILESHDQAVSRGAKIYAEVLGGGISADSYHMTAPCPQGKGAAKSIQSALLEANLHPSSIDYINLHATSTAAGDLSEMRAVKRIFGALPHDIFLGATKSMTGHLLGAAGAIEAIICTKVIETGQIPPTINLDNPDVELATNCIIPIEPLKHEVRYALSNNFGFGGHNASLVFGSI